MRLPTWTRYLLLLLIAGAGGGLSILAASYLYLAPQLPPASQIREVEYQIPLRIYSNDIKLIAEYGEKRRQPVSFDELPETLVQAVLAAEDERFFRHNGVDLKGLVRAAVELARYREIRSGGSTITMQVARNFFLSRDQRFLRKFNEIVLAIQIERVLSKEEILELYLNKIYLGHRAYGAEAAAQVYYGKSVGELNIAQQAMIAGLPKAPSAYNPITNPERARIRRNWILFRMEETGALTREEREIAQSEPVSARFHAAQPEVDAAYVGEMVRLQAARLVEQDIFTDGIRRMRVIVDVEKALENEGHEVARALERTAVLSIIDDKWMDHLRELDAVKEGVGLRAFGQKDPLLEYKREAFEMFKQLLDEINQEAISLIWKAIPEMQADQQKMQQAPEERAKVNMNKAKTEHSDATNMGFKSGSGQNQNGGQQQQQRSDQKPQPVTVEEEPGRNDYVKIQNMSSGEVIDIKWKKAKRMIDEESWVLIEK